VNNIAKAGRVQVFIQDSVTQDWIPRGLPLTGRNDESICSAVAINTDDPLWLSEPT
jgi:hypothetical protein